MLHLREFHCISFLSLTADIFFILYKWWNISNWGLRHRRSYQNKVREMNIPFLNMISYISYHSSIIRIHQIISEMNCFKKLPHLYEIIKKLWKVKSCSYPFRNFINLVQYWSFKSLRTAKHIFFMIFHRIWVNANSILPFS